MRIWMIIFFLGLGLSLNAQHVINNGKVYQVKGKSIFHEGNDVTSTLNKENKDNIFKSHKNNSKATKNAEKAKKKQDKIHDQTVKDLKNKQKAQDKFNKATKKLDQNQEKYDKLKAKGKLSPNDEAKWQKKLEGYKKDLEKTKKNLLGT